MDVSVIMINYNTYDLTCNALDSIFGHTAGLEYEIILIDNKSPDGSGELISQKYGQRIKYIQSGGNLGTSRAFNLGVKNSSGKYVLWLNTDIIIKHNFIYELFGFMEGNPSCGICGGNVLGFDGRPAHSYRKKINTPYTARRDFSVTVAVFRKLFKKLLSEQYNYTGKPLEVGYITGADMMIRRTLFDEVGLFDENIFMYAEEVEFTYRVITSTSYKVYSVPSAQIYHLEGASFNGREKRFNLNRYKLCLKGNLIYFYRHFGKSGVISYLKLCIRSYKKFIFGCTFLFKKQKKSEYKTKLRVVREYLCAAQGGTKV